jgi:hypothetical protein
MGRHQVVVGEHGQAAAGHLGQLSDVQVRLGGGHLADLAATTLKWSMPSGETPPALSKPPRPVRREEPCVDQPAVHPSSAVGEHTIAGNGTLSWENKGRALVRRVATSVGVD